MAAVSSNRRRGGRSQGRIRRLLCAAVLVLACALSIAACSSGPSSDPLPPVAHGDPVSIYMQNLTKGPVEFAMRPLGDPPVIFAVDGGEVGGGCTRVPTNWQLAQTEAGKPPGDAAVLRILARDQPGGAPRSVWVSVTEEGFTTGEGVPPWWTGAVQLCGS